MMGKDHHVRILFPDKHHIVDYLLSVDPEFSSLCEDLDTCAFALRYWSESSLPEANTRLNEYRILIHELKEEIAAFINEIKSQ